MANDPPFATLNHVAGDLGIPSESALLRFGIRNDFSAVGPGSGSNVDVNKPISFQLDLL
jgi:hypothetical protein